MEGAKLFFSLSLFFVPWMGTAQCGQYTLQDDLWYCNQSDLYTARVEFTVHSGTSPFTVQATTSGTVFHVANGAPPITEYFTVDDGSTFDWCKEFTVVDGNGCASITTLQSALYFTTWVWFDPGGRNLDCNTGEWSQQIQVPYDIGIWEGSYEYFLTGPYFGSTPPPGTPTQSGYFTDLPTTFPLFGRVIEDLAPGNYLIGFNNQNNVSCGPGCYCYVDCLALDGGMGFSFTIPAAPSPGDCGVNVGPQVCLQAAMTSSGTLMNDSLRTLGLLPLDEPYSSLGYNYTDPASGGATIPQGLLDTTGNNAVVDWVIVELRSVASPYTLLASRPALLQRDGDVVDLDGDDYVNFPSQTEGNYRIAVRHRNHLGIMSGGQLLGASPKTVPMNLDPAAILGPPEATIHINGRECMWSGDVNFDGSVQYTGLGNDRDPILQEIGGSIPTNVTTGYSTRDVNMDGEIRYTGPGNDRDPILQNIGGSVPTNVVDDQLP